MASAAPGEAVRVGGGRNRLPWGPDPICRQYSPRNGWATLATHGDMVGRVLALAGGREAARPRVKVNNGQR
jgi:hypothetical protein